VNRGSGALEAVEAVGGGRMVPAPDPVAREYAFVYSEGEALLRRWLDTAPAAERAARFGRLLREQLTPRAIGAEIEAAAAGA